MDPLSNGLPITLPAVRGVKAFRTSTVASRPLSNSIKWPYKAIAKLGPRSRDVKRPGRILMGARTIESLEAQTSTLRISLARRGEGGFQGGPGLQGREGVLEKSRGFAPLLRHDPGGQLSQPRTAWSGSSQTRTSSGGRSTPRRSLTATSNAQRMGRAEGAAAQEGRC